MEPVFWNRFGSSVEIQNSVVGDNGVEYGTVNHPTGYFGNGSSISSSGGNYVEFPYNNIPDWRSPGTWEWWCKTPPSLPVGHQNHIFFIIYDGTHASVDIGFMNGASVMRFKLINAAGDDIVDTTIGSLSQGTWYHMAFTWDFDNTVDGTNYCIFYVDGSISYAQNTTSTHGNGFKDNLEVLNISIANTKYYTGIIDNIKMYDKIKTDYSDRFQERGAMNDQVIIL